MIKQWAYRITVALIIAVLFYIFYPNSAPNPRPAMWGLEKNAVPSKVLNIEIGKTTLLEAIPMLKSTPDIAMFTEKNKTGGKERTQHLEAFFSGIFDEDDDIILGLNSPKSLYEHIQKSATKPQIFPNGAIRIDISENILEEVTTLTISNITVVTGNQINFEVFQEQFGKPEQLIDDGQGNAHFLYPQLGLDFIQPSGGSQILQFVALDAFDTKLRQPLLKSLSQGAN